MMDGVLDTSVFIAIEQGRHLAIEHLPRKGGVSVATLAELEIGVRLARGERTQARRRMTLGLVETRFTAVPIDKAIAVMFGELASALGRSGWRKRVQDLWIAATAKVHAVPVFTQDGDFDDLRGVEVVRV